MRIVRNDLLILCEKFGIRGCLHKNLYLLAPYDANISCKKPRIKISRANIQNSKKLVSRNFLILYGTYVILHTSSSLIQTILSVPDSHRISCSRRSRTVCSSVQKIRITVGRESTLLYHPAPKNSLFFLHDYCMHSLWNCQYPFLKKFIHSASLSAGSAVSSDPHS